MSKAIRWQVHFASISGTKYRVDIYDEGYTGTPVQLLGGTSPFTTDEDDSDDYFAPIRVQTGTLQVCTALPNGGRISLDELLPANNIARPVRLMNLDTSPATIEWQGFLSCEAYSQDYTSIPQILQLPVISVLEAMASVDVPQSSISGTNKINEIIADMIAVVDTEAGVETFTHVNYSMSCWRFFSKYIDTSTFYEESVNSDNNSDVLVTTGISIKDAIERICRYMGMVARERGTEIYFQRLIERNGMIRQTVGRFRNYFHTYPYNSRSLQVDDLDDQVWMGDDHKLSVSGGAKKVGVVAKLEDFDFGLKLPSFPEGDTTDVIHVGEQIVAHYDTIFNKNVNAFNFISFIFYQCSYEWTDDYSSFARRYVDTSTLTTAMNASKLGGGSQGGSRYFTSKYPGTFFVNTIINEGGHNDAPAQQGLYCVFCPTHRGPYFETVSDHYMFRIRTTKKYSFRAGKLNLKLNFSYFWGTTYNGGDGDFEGNGPWTKRIAWTLKIGMMYYDYDNDMWTSVRTLNISAIGQALEHGLTISSYLSGIVIFELLADSVSVSETGSSIQRVLLAALADSFELSYEANNARFANNRSENKYTTIINANFRDEISIDTDYASYMNNKTSPSFIMETTDTPMETLNYSVTAEDDLRRPESDLLDRLALYYHKKRRTLSLVMAPTDMPYEHAQPIVVFNGLSPDTKQYIPLAEDRDWRQNISTVKCFEIPASNDVVDEGGGGIMPFEPLEL